MASIPSESLSMTIHLGPFQPKGIQDEVHQTLRAVMSLEKRSLKKAKLSTKDDRVKVHGDGITFSIHGKERWIHLITEIDAPVSRRKLAVANNFNNSIATFLTRLFRGTMKVTVTVIIAEKLLNMHLTKALSPDWLKKVHGALGFEVVPNGLWLVSKSEGEDRSIIVTGKEKQYEVNYVHYFPTGTEIRKDILMETYKNLKETIPRSLSILQAG